MAISFLRMSNVSRAIGSNSCATLSYITGLKVRDERTAQTFRFIGKERVRSFDMLLPAGASFDSPEALFNSIETAEKAKNARTAKKIVIALPRECEEKWEQMLEQWIRTSLNARGYAAVYAIHTDAENNNPHAHVLVPNRPLTEKGTWGKKQTEQFVDAEGNVVDKAHRVPRMRGGKQVTDKQGRKKWLVKSTHHALDEKEILPAFKAEWQEECNKYLEAAQQLDFRSYEEQGKDRVAQVHEGPRARGRVARGEKSDICDRNEAAKLYNAEAAMIEQLELEFQEAAPKQATERERLLAMLEAANADAYIMYPLDYDAAVAHFQGRRDVIVVETANERDALTALRRELSGAQEENADQMLQEQEVNLYGRIADTVRRGFVAIRERIEKLRRFGAQIAERIAALARRTFVRDRGRDGQTGAALARCDGREPGTAQATGRGEKTRRFSRSRTGAVIRDTLRDYRPHQSKAAGSVQADRRTPGIVQPESVQLRPSTSYERQAVVRQAEKALSSIAVTDFIARHGIHVKARRVKVNGRRYDALRMPDGRDIVISEASNSFWQYADRYGFTGGGSVLQLAMVYLPEYQMKKGNWDEIVIKLAENECPDAVRLYAYRPVTQADSGRISLAERIRQIRSQQQPHQQSRDESRSRGEER